MQTTAAFSEYVLTVKDDPITSWMSKCHLILFFSVSLHSSRQHPGHDVWFVSLSPTHGIINVSTARFICCTLYTFTSHTPESHFPVFEALFVLLDPPRWWINSLPSLPWVKCPCLDDFPRSFIHVCVSVCACVYIHLRVNICLYICVCMCALMSLFFLLWLWKYTKVSFVQISAQKSTGLFQPVYLQDDCE